MDKPVSSPVQPLDDPFGGALHMLGYASFQAMSSSASGGASGGDSATLTPAPQSAPLVSSLSSSRHGSAQTWRNQDAGAIHSVVVEDGPSPGRVGDALLPASRYQGRVLNPDSEEAKRTSQRAAHYVPGLMGKRRRHGGRRAGEDGTFEEEDEDEMHREGLPRVVVDGVEDLQHATTGLLTRHLGEELNTAPSTLAQRSVHYLATKPTYPASSARTPTPAGAQTRAPPIDDRVTPQALHQLLRKGQQQAAHKLTHARLNGRYYTFAAGPGAKEAATAALERAEADNTARQTAARFAAAVAEPSSPETRSRLPAVAGTKGRKDGKGVVRSRHTVKGPTPQDFVRATHSPAGAAMNPLLRQEASKSKTAGVGLGSRNGDDDDNEDVDAQLAFLRAQLARSGLPASSAADKAVLAANIAYLEPPSIAAAHDALYRARALDDEALSPGGDDEDEGEDGEAVVAMTAGASSRRHVPYVSPELAPHGPPPSAASAVMTYPPPPVVYASAEAEKKARDRHRLRPIKLRTKAEMAAKGGSGVQGGPLSKGVRDALISTTGGIGTGAADADHSTFALYDNDDDKGSEDREGVQDEDEDDMDPYGEDAKKFGIEMDVEGVKSGVALDFAFSAALRGDDRQLVEQLAQQYGEQCLRRQLEARRQAQQRRLRAMKLTGTAPPTLETLTAQNLRNHTAKGHTLTTKAAPDDATTTPPLAVVEPPFSVLESVLAVSREFERIRPALLTSIVEPDGSGGSGAASSSRFLAGAAVPLTSSVLARERRALVDQLTAFGSSRIPGRFWVTLQERGGGAASRQAVASGSAGGAGGAGGGGETMIGMHNAAARQSMARLSTTGGPGTGAGAALGGYVRHRVPIMADFSEAPRRGTGGMASAMSEVPASVVAVSHVPKDGSVLTRRPNGGADDAAGGADDEGGGERGEPSAANVLFPAIRPTGRAQVYLLAETIDHMLLHDSSLLKAVTDPEVAYRILPRAVENASNADREEASATERAGENGDVSAEWLLTHTREAQHPLLDVAARTDAEASFHQYTEAAAQVLAVVDAGLVEVVRQVACVCVERGALLDVLRQTLVDLTDSSLHVLSYAKERACEEAVHSLQLRRELERERRARLALEAAGAQATRDVTRLQAENERLGEKAAHLDLLVARAEAKRNRFDLEADDDDHAGLLKALEEEINIAAMNAMNDLYEAEAGLGTGGVLPTRRGEAPSAAEARRRLTEQKATTDQLYQESYTLLRTMNTAVSAMNDATAPLYKPVALNTVSLNANVAAGRWAEVARAVGAFEADKKHRYHVFQVFSDWCDRYQSVHQLDEGGVSVRGSTAFLVGLPDDDVESTQNGFNSSHDSPDRLPSAAAALMSSSSLLGVDDGGDSEGLEDGDGTSLRQSIQSTRLSLQGRRHHIHDLVRAKIRQQQEETSSRGGTAGMPSERATTQAMDAEPGANAEEALHQVLQSIQYATADDLLAMGVDDCSVDEINAMFARDFDFRAYLFTAWEPRQANYTLNMPDVIDMIHDVTATMQEMTLRMKALSQSAIVRRGVEPPLQPPSRPGDACHLCGRRDGAAEEKRRRQETMRVIAHQVQLRMDQMKEKCQHAEADREVAREESRRLQNEVNTTLQREQVLRKQLRDLTEQMSSGSGKIVAAGRQGARGGSGSTRASPIGSPRHGRSPHKRATGLTGSSSELSGSIGPRTAGSPGGRVSPPVTSILTPTSGTNLTGSRSPSPPLLSAMAATAANSLTHNGLGADPAALPLADDNTGGPGRASARRASTVVGIIAPDDGSSRGGAARSSRPPAHESGFDDDSGGSPLRRHTLPPSASNANAGQGEDADEEEA